MDELTIDDKKYISSKRAAQITGYAKDYIGQLCREGYVAAKRVGRSWYVLEAAIKDHRFGGAAPVEPKAAPTPAARFTLSRELPTEIKRPVADVAAPKYEAIPPPSINLLRHDEPVTGNAGAHVADAGAPQDFHDAWQTWFETFHAPQGAVQGAVDTEQHARVAEPPPTFSINPVPAPIAQPPPMLPVGEEEVHVPIHHLAPPEAKPIEKRLAPPPPILEMRMEDVMHHKPHGLLIKDPKRKGSPLINMAAAVLGIASLVSIALAAVGAGYFDSQLASSRQAELIDGVSIYNK